MCCTFIGLHVIEMLPQFDQVEDSVDISKDLDPASLFKKMNPEALLDINERTFHILPQMYTANHATFPIQINAITV